MQNQWGFRGLHTGCIECNHTVKNFIFANISSYLNTFAKSIVHKRQFLAVCADFLKYKMKSLITSAIVKLVKLNVHNEYSKM